MFEGYISNSSTTAELSFSSYFLPKSLSCSSEKFMISAKYFYRKLIIQNKQLNQQKNSQKQYWCSSSRKKTKGQTMG
jgi:hypothetical protein